MSKEIFGVTDLFVAVVKIGTMTSHIEVCVMPVVLLVKMLDP